MSRDPDSAPTGSAERGVSWWRVTGWVAWVLLALAVADWMWLRRGSAPHPPSWLVALVGLTTVAFLARGLAVLAAALRGLVRPVTAAGELLAILGVVGALAAGSANWLLGLQGYVILREREVARLREGADLQMFEAGPLADLEEMDLRIGLDELEFVPTGDGAFFPRSILQVDRRGERTRTSTDPHTAGQAGSLRFYQGAFGFAPRVVILRGEELLFDRVVPFVTRLHDRRGITFSESFDVESTRLHVDGEIDLASLDEAMRGHASLSLSLSRDGEPLGQGTLLPGHFADLDAGFRVGFAGLERWSEIDVARRNYAGPVLAGGVAALLGVLLWPLAAWRGW